MIKKFALLLFLLLVLCSCDDAPQMIETIISDPIPTSEYTGILRRVNNTVEKFGTNADDAVALAFGNNTLYMLASKGNYPNEGQYLFTLDRHTGTADVVNPGARNLGGDFSQGRGFTQVYGVSPKDMTWYHDTLLAICPVIDSTVAINPETGFAERLHTRKDFCLFTEDGYPQLGGGIAITTVEEDSGMLRVFIAGVARGKTSTGYRIHAGLYRMSDNPSCAKRVGNIEAFGIEETTPYAFCTIGNTVYMSGGNTGALHIIDLDTGEAHFVAKWDYSEIPPGHAVQEIGGYVNLEENVGSQTAPWVTGLAYDGKNMYAVCGFTDALYIVNTKKE